MSPAGVTFRLARGEDAPALADLRWRLRTETDAGPASEERAAFVRRCSDFLSQALAQANWTCWVAEDDGRIAATAYLQRVPKLPRPGQPLDFIGYLTSVYADPALRNRGIGEALLRRVRDWADENQVELMIVWPSSRSRSLYGRLGFAGGDAVMELVLKPE